MAGTGALFKISGVKKRKRKSKKKNTGKNEGYNYLTTSLVKSTNPFIRTLPLPELKELLNES